LKIIGRDFFHSYKSFSTKKLSFSTKITIAFTVIELLVTDNYALAQIIPDETLANESSVLTPNVNIKDSEVDRIDGGAKRGTNLFHSFREFNVGENQKIYFSNPTEIKNIFSRITGTNISNIQGTLGVDGIANLFLINPNGIIFGANASLDLKGSFLASTADAVKFADGISFSATNPSERSLLSINVPIGLQLPGNPQRIELQGSNLALDSAKTLAFVGGEVTLNGGKISNPGGTVELGGLATENTVGLNNVDGNLSLTFPEEIARADVSLSNYEVNVSADGGGSIAIHAKDLKLAGASTLQGGITKTSNLASVNDRAGDIIIDATGQISLDNSSIFAGVAKELVGNGGNIKISTSSLSLNNGARLSTAHSGEQGNAGNVIINARDTVSFDAEDSIDYSNVLTNVGVGAQGDLPGGNAGEITITTGSLYFNNGARLNSSNAGRTGNAGNVTINATNTVYFEGSDRSENFNGGIMTIVQPAGKGNAGDIIITTASLYLKNGASLLTRNSGTQGNSGNVTITATNQILFDGEAFDYKPSGIFVNAIPGSPENTDSVNAGQISITTGSFYLTNGARLEANTNRVGNAGNIKIDALEQVSFEGTNSQNEPSGAFANVQTGGKGKGGDINISTNELLLIDGARIESTSLGNGGGGQVTIDTLERVELSGVFDFFNTELQKPEKKPGGVFTTVRGTGVGNAGNITITTNFLSITGGAKLETLTRGQGNAGNVIIEARDIFLDGVVLQPDGENSLPSSIASSVQPTGNGNGGNIVINTSSLKLTDGALFTASTRGEGNGGNIFINTDNISVDGFGINNVSSGIYSSVDKPDTGNAKGQGGRIVIEANSLSLSNGALLSTGTFDEGNAGDIEIKAKNVEITRGAQILTTAASSGNAGNITINTNGGNITLIGSDPNLKKRNYNLAPNILKNQGEASGLFANTTEESTNSGGNIAVESGLLTMRDGAKITTNNEGSSNGGNINIAADFIIASPSENSDISANAIRGNGGNVTIDARGIVGIADREKNTLESDITASSELGIDGTVSIDSTTIDPNQGLIVLPEKIVDASALITTSCGVNEENSAGQFSMTGRGGLPTNPNEVLSSQDLWEDLRSENFDNKVRSQLNPAPQKIDRPLATIAEATGWNVSKNGKVTLVATNSNAKNISHSCRTASGQKSKVKSQ
jgi:filamentous hemagglutinin family protein